MPSARQKRAADQNELEAIIQEGCQLLARQAENGGKPNYTQVHADLEAHHKRSISYSTLYKRAKGMHLSRPISHAEQQLLSPVQEFVLVEWLVYLSDTGHPLSKRTLRKKAEHLCGRKPGTTWTRQFLLRHPEIQLGKPSGLDPKRGQAFNRPTVKHHFELLLSIIEKHGIPIENIYNMDEKGCQRGGGRRSSGRKYFIPRGKRPKYKTKSANLELITIVECVAADGGNILPGFIFPGKEFSPEWGEVDPKICISMSENGWTDDFLCEEWFEKSFIPQVKERNTSGKPILLIYDGHGSHSQLSIIRLACEHGIILFCLPPHTTHKLQPLDVGVFGPFSREWIERCDDITEELGREMPKEDFVKEYMAIRGRTFKETTVRSAFRKSGISPLDPTVFTDADFAPSLATSYTDSGLPPTYPDHQSFSDDEHGLENLDDDDDDDDDDEIFFVNHTDSTQSMGAPSQPNTERVASQSRNTASVAPRASSQPTTTLRPTPIPPSQFYAKHPPRPSRSILSLSSRPHHSLAAANKENEVLRQENIRLWKENETVYTHAQLAGDEVRGMKRKLNARDSRVAKKPKVVTESRCLTSDQLVAQFEADEQVREAERQRKEAAEQTKRAEQEARDRARSDRDATHVFTGSLASKGKEDLKDVASFLRLDITGTKNDILERIKAHFQSHPELYDDPQYVALFPRRGRAPTAQDTVAGSSTHTQTALHIADTHANQPVRPLGPSFLAPMPYIYHNPSYYNNQYPPQF